MDQRYDIIGDIHGQADLLIALLAKMGYQEIKGVWNHPDRKAIFVGDFVDVGPKQVETVLLVKKMVESGAALAVLGNHDLNAIAWYLPDPSNSKDYLRSHFSQEWGEKNRHQHSAFLAEVEDHPDLHRSIIEWFLTLPLWLDLSGLRVVHACWHAAFIEFLKPILLPGARLSRELMPAAALEPDDQAKNHMATPSIFQAVEAVTKGIEVSLPAGMSFKDGHGLERTQVRIRWWDQHATTFRTAALLNTSMCDRLSTDALPESTRVFHGTDVPVFFGHYWLKGEPSPLTNKIACVDYGAAHGGPLCAYRWAGESDLLAENFCCVDPI